jgi:pimeloyl-ACP methyl ester carboxylesterase
VLKPFEQMRFEALPEKPRVPHGFFDVPEERVKISSSHFGDITLSVRRRGRGDPLVLVHGLMTSSYSWRYVLEPLAERFEVIVFDLPGAGRSDAPDVPYGPRELAELVYELMEELGVTGAPIVGNSMGGYLSMWLALKRPSAMSRLVNLHSPGVVTPRMTALELALGIPYGDAILDRLVRRDPLRWAFKNVHYYDETLKSLEEAREYGAPLATERGRRAFYRYLKDTLAASAMKELASELRALPGGRFPVPLTLIYARRDPMVPPEVGTELAKLIPSAKLVWLEEGSHFAHVDAPSAFLAAALPFLTAH